ncbi:hypothetical protein CYY_009596 [Polysphondylium violaceum]|uniref:C2 NT-type domain-containing protein n=1 Tax=Polysphondylium violaceum TaxID=133409 RepID=A0A8J4PJV8_9MYCE|nr:hypothetical protein CYY_009596 [Polysphondylium violaceum]
MDKLNSVKSGALKGMSKIRGPSTREQSKFQFDIKLLNVDNVNVSSGSTVIISWKRGSKSTNNGKTKALNVASNKSVAINHPLTLTTTLYKEKPPKKGYESKTIVVSIKEDKGKKASSIGKTLLDLAEYTANTSSEQFKSIPIKVKKGGPMMLTMNIRTKEMEMTDDEPMTETDMGESNDGSDDEDVEDIPDDDSDVSTATSTSHKPSTTVTSSNLSRATSSSSINNTPTKHSPVSESVMFKEDNTDALNALLGKPSSSTKVTVTKHAEPDSLFDAKAVKREQSGEDSYYNKKRVLELENQVTELQKDLRDMKNKPATSGISSPAANSAEFVELKKRIKELASDNVDLEDQVKDLQDKLANAQKAAVSGTKDSKMMSDIQDQLRQKDNQISDLNAKIRRLERDNGEKESEVAKHQDTIKQIKQDLSAANAAAAAAVAAASAASLSGSKNNNSDAQEEIEYLRREIQLLKESNAPQPMVGGGTLELKRKIQDLTKEVKDKDEMINRLKSGGGSGAVSPTSPSSNNNSNNSTNIELTKTVNQQKQELAQQKQEIATLQQQLQASQKKSPSTGSSTSGVDEMTKRENIDLKDKINALTNENKRLTERCTTMNEDLENINNQLESNREHDVAREQEYRSRIQQLEEEKEMLENKMNNSMASASALSFGAGRASSDKSKDKESKYEKERLEKELDQTKNELSRERERTKKLEREIKDLKDRLRSLEQDMESASGGRYQPTMAKSDHQEQEENKIIEQCIYTQSFTFRDGVGSCASSLLAQLSDMSAFSNENSRLFTKVTSALTQSIERSMYNSADLCYWLSNISGLIHLIKDGPNNIDNDRDPIIDGILVYQSTNSPISSSRKSPSLTFYYSLENLCREVYSLLLHNIYNKLKPKLSSILDQGSCILDKHTNRLSHTNHLNKICKVLEKYLNMMKDKFVFDAIIQQFFSQVFHFISFSLLNDILNQEHQASCSPTFGFTIKLSLSKIEDWLSTIDDRELLIPTRDNLMAIIEAANLMVIDKSIFTDSESIISAFSTLNILQIKKLLEIWKPDHLSPDPIPSSVISMARSNWNRPITNQTLIIDPTILIETQPSLS